MPPGPTAPCSLAGLLAEFRPCFTAPTFQTFIGLVVGLIAQTRRRTVCGMLTGAGLEQVWHHSRAHRLFTNARWSGDALGLALADLIVTQLLPVGAGLTIAVDDTLFKRSGKKVFGVAWCCPPLSMQTAAPLGFSDVGDVSRPRRQDADGAWSLWWRGGRQGGAGVVIILP